MTITYPDGSVLKAIVLSHEDHEIRAIAPGYEDVLAFTRIHDIWISKDAEPVTIKLEWQRRVATHCGSGDGLCREELPARLIPTLFQVWALEKAGPDTLSFSARREPASPSIKVN